MVHNEKALLLGVVLFSFHEDVMETDAKIFSLQESLHPQNMRTINYNDEAAPWTMEYK
jgi:hypothetical protein